MIPEKNRYNLGITSSPEVWNDVTNLALRISSLVPALVERTPPQPPPPRIVSGPAQDELGYPSISLLLKRHCGDAYVITVNGTIQDVTAEFDLGVGASEALALWEDGRRVPISAGRLVDKFAPLAVHVYKIHN